MSKVNVNVTKARLEKEANERKKIEENLNMKVLKTGDAANFPKLGDSIQMHYVGFLEDGTMFDNSYNRGVPICFIFGQNMVVRGIEMALPVLSRGERARIKLTPDLAYGSKGFPPVIPPGATIIYEIELVTFTSVGHAEMVQRNNKATMGAAAAAINAVAAAANISASPGP
jgi:FK506-binding protein 1